MSDQTFRDIELKILAASNYGLDIIQDIYSAARPGKNFRIRDYHDDKNESASLKLITNDSGVQAYRLTDFGGTVHNENCFGIYALTNNLSYTEAVLEIANEYQAKGHQILETEKVIYKADYRECKPEEFTGKLNEKGFSYKVKDFTAFELGLLGPEIRKYNEDDENGKLRVHLITPKVCDEVNLKSLEGYSFLNKDGTKVCTFRSTEKFPILAFINVDDEIGEWLKIYKPRAGKKFTEDGKDYRFHHLGGRPSKFIFGLERLEDLLLDYRLKMMREDPELEEESIKLPRITIATGGSDGLNLLALGEPVVWFNSETTKIDKYTLTELKTYAEVIINVPDCDATGKREGRDLALQFMDIRTLWLDSYFKNNRNKDFKDFCKENQSLTLRQLTKKVNDMMEATMPAKFWSSDYNEKTKKYSHSFSPTFAFYFLRLNGFCRVLDESRKDGYYFARINGNVVEEIDVTKIKNFFRDFLTEKQRKEGVREISYSLMDALITTTRISESTMDRLHARELDFSDFDHDAQYFFIGNKVYKTTKDGTKASTFDRYVLKSQLIDELIYNGTGRRLNADRFKIESEKVGEIDVQKKFFEIKEIGPGSYDIKINETKCEFFNYVIQTSRVHWQDEMKAFADNGFSDEDFYKKTKFRIESKYLQPNEIHTQKQHLVNKIYTLGYLLHRFKDESRPYIPYAVDEAVLDDDAAEGGAGKSIFFKALKFICNVHPLSGKADFENDKFLFEGITAHTDIMFMDDVKRNFDLKLFYDATTGDLIVNTKNEKKYTIPYALSPKLVITSNYSLRDQSGSSKRRRLVNGFSDYFHAENDERGERTPKDDFGHIFFTDWDEQKWFKYINFLFQCLQFYLSTKEKINAPSNNILLRTYFIEMGAHFQEWADAYIPNIIGTKVLKETALAACREANKKYLADLSPNKFTKKMTAWCKANGFDFHNRINEGIWDDGQKRKITKEHILVASPDFESTEETSVYDTE